uniref:CSON008742 protein n=1 Tax=Culicoides sonorensis TaxID=179676 RepID=A0A336LZ25_CULSO
MKLWKQLIGLCLFAVVVSGNHYDQYTPKYSEPSYQHGYKKDVKLHKLCSWNVVNYAPGYYVDRDESWSSCKVDSGRGLIPENNIPIGFFIHHDRRVFVTLPRERLGVGSTVAYFHLDDIKNGQCPPLVPYPPRANYTLDAECCSPDNLVNVNRVYPDSCDRMWGVDRNALSLKPRNKLDTVWEHGSPVLFIYDLKTDCLVRRVPIPAEIYAPYQLGFLALTVFVDPKDCNNAYAYISDTDNGCVVVYSFKKDKFWKVCSPEFFSDAKYSKLNVKTRKNTDVTYWKTSFLTDCTKNLKDDELLCTSDSSLYVFSVPFADLNSEEAARCYPSKNVHILGKKCHNCQSVVHTINQDNLVLWQVQEQRYGVGCWNRDNPLTPDTVQTVVSDLHRLPYVTDVIVTNADLSKFKDHEYHDKSYDHKSYDHISYDHKPYDHKSYDHGYHKYDENYVVTFSNNYQGILNDGFDHKEENFGFYFFVEKEALEAYPECLAKSYKQSSYEHPQRHNVGYSHKPQTYHPQSYQNHHQPQSYQQHYQPKPAPVYVQPKPAPVHVEPKPAFRPTYGRTYRNTESNEDDVKTIDVEE